MNQDSTAIFQAYRDSIQKVYKTYDTTSYFYEKQDGYKYLPYKIYKNSVNQISKTEIRNDSMNCLKTSNKNHFFRTYIPNKYLTEKELSKQRFDVATQWIFIVVLIQIFAISFTRIYYNKLIRKLFLSLFNFKESQKTFASNRTNYLTVSNILNTVYYSILALFFYINIVYFKIDFIFLPDLLIFIVLTLLMFLLYQFKQGSLNLINKLVSNANIANEYNFNIMLYSKLNALLLLPIVAVISFVKNNNTELFIFIGFIILTISYIIRLIRGGQILFDKQVSIFYMILYLCTLEIIPLLVTIKLIDKYLLK